MQRKGRKKVERRRDEKKGKSGIEVN